MTCLNFLRYKLKFKTPLHCGDGENARSVEGAQTGICADTLFSALCSQAAAEHDGGMLAALCKKAGDGTLLFSDLFPYCGTSLYVPRPAMLPRVFCDIMEPDRRKIMKSLEYIPLDRLDEYAECMNSGMNFQTEGIRGSFAERSEYAHVSIKGLDVSSPYFTAARSFDKGCGLWGIVASDDEEFSKDVIDNLMVRLGLGGIGGKVSSGYGKFKVLTDEYYVLASEEDAFDDETDTLWRMLSSDDSPSYVSLTTSLPGEEELDGAMDGAMTVLKRRGGFVASDTFGSVCKKDTQYFFAAGSVFRRKYSGALFNTAHGGNHPVYRYSKPIFLGVGYR